MRNQRRFRLFARFSLLIIATLALSCGSQDEHESTPETAAPSVETSMLTLAEFVAFVDADRGVFDLRMLSTDEWSTPITVSDDLRTVPQALWCEMRVTAGAAGTVSMSTDPDSIANTASACGLPSTFPYSMLGAFCADVSIHSYLDEVAIDVMAEILIVNPPEFTGYTFTGTGGLLGVDADNLPGPNPPTDAAGGLFGYGDLAPAATAVEQWVFRNPGGTFDFRGRIVSQVTEVCNGVDDDCDGEVDEGAGCLPFDTPCTSHFDCQSGNCAESGRCGASLCSNGLMDGSESDIDCGGTCAGCSNGDMCASAADCASGNCRAGLCVQYRHPLAGEIVVTEFMADPGVGDTDGEWIELYNASDDTLDLEGCVIRDEGANSHLIGPLSVAAGDYLVMARSGDAGANHGVGEDYVYGSELSLANSADEILIECAGLLIDRVAYTSVDVSRGASSQLHNEQLTALANDVSENFCPSRLPYSIGYLGSPGGANVSCDLVIDRCRLQSPTVGDAPAGGSHQVFGRVIIPGLTEDTTGVDTALRLHAAVGYGDSDTDPATNSSWTWVTATANTTWNDASEPNYDEYQATISVPDSPGTSRDVAFRFSGDNGNTFTYCDVNAGAGADGSENGYQIANAGVMNITGAAAAPATEGDLIINEFMPRAANPDDGNGDWIELYNPGASPLDLAGCILSDLGTDSHAIAASVIVPAGGFAVLARSADAVANFGVPQDYVYDSFALGNGDDEIVLTCGGTEIDRVVYDSGYVTLGASASLLPTRTSITDNDLAVAWCANQASVTYGSAGKIGTPGQGNVPCYTLNWCRLQSPLDLVDQRWGGDVLVFGRVDIPGLSNLTDGTDTAPQIVAQAGYGADGSDPSAGGGAGWTWFAGEANTGYDNGSVDFFPGHDEYQSTMTLPTDGAQRDFAMRFSADGGTTWPLYCDRRIGSVFSTDGSADGYQPINAGQLDMDADYAIGWCSLHWPVHVPDTLTALGMPVPFAGAPQTFYGRLYVAGVTEPAGPQERANILAQFGHGADGTDPDAGGWTWADADANTGVCFECWDNDEYEYTLTVPTATAAPYDTAFRFSGNGGLSWTYCDGDGTLPPAAYEIAQAGHLQPATATIGWCDMQAHRSFTGTEGDSVSVEMRVYGPDLTPRTTGAPDASPDFLAELMYVEDTGAPLPDPRSSSAPFTLVTGNLTGGVGNDDLYTATFSLPTAADYRTAIRFSGDGGTTWGVCGQVGLLATVDDMGTMTVTSAGPPPFDCLRFSQYVEGSSFNKAVEIWNCGDSPIERSDYSICKYVNGSTGLCSNLAMTAGSLAAGETWTICHSGGSYGTGRCDQSTSSSAINFNGNDEIVLLDATAGNAVLDRLGITGDSGNWGKDDTRHRTSCWASDGTATGWTTNFVLAGGGVTNADLDHLGTPPSGFACAAGTGNAVRCTIDMDNGSNGSCPDTYRICGALFSNGAGCADAINAFCGVSGSRVYPTNVFVASNVDLGDYVTSVEVFFGIIPDPFGIFGYDLYDGAVGIYSELLDAGTHNCSAAEPSLITLADPGGNPFNIINFSSGLGNGYIDSMTIER